MKMDEWKRRFVRLKEDTRTSGGDVFTKGEVLVVTGHHQGKLTLNRPNNTNAVNGVRGHCIRRVERHDVELLPEKPHLVLKAILAGAEALAKSVGGVLAYELDVENVEGRKILDVFRPEKVRMFQAVGRGEIERDEKGLPKALLLG